MRHYRWTQNTLFEFAEKPFAHLDQNTLSTPRGHSKDTQRTHVGEHPGVPDVLSIAIFGVIRVHMDSSHMNGIAESIHGVQRAYWNNWRFFCPAAVSAKLQQLSVQTLLWWRSIKGYGSWLTPSSCRFLCPANSTIVVQLRNSSRLRAFSTSQKAACCLHLRCCWIHLLPAPSVFCSLSFYICKRLSTCNTWYTSQHSTNRLSGSHILDHSYLFSLNKDRKHFLRACQTFFNLGKAFPEVTQTLERKDTMSITCHIYLKQS